MIEIETLPQEIVDRKTVFLKSRLDSNKARLLGEDLKASFFVKLGFLKPSPSDIRLVALDKYYEPYIIIGGKYSIDYCKKHRYEINVGEDVREIYFNGKKFKPQHSPSEAHSRTVEFKGEEYSHYEDETYFVLDRVGREISPDKLALAPSIDPKEGQPPTDLNLKRIQISPENELAFLKSRIVRRPSDVAEIIRETFEVNERTTIYSPMYHLAFQNIKTGKEVIVFIDSITGEIVPGAFPNKVAGKYIEDLVSASVGDRASLPPGSLRSEIKPLQTHRDSDSSERIEPKSDSEIQRPGKSDDLGSKPISVLNEVSVPKPDVGVPVSFKGKDYTPKIHAVEEEELGFPAKATGQVYIVGDNVTAVIGDLEIPSETSVNETLVVKGNLKIGDRCLIVGRLKALGNIVIGVDTTVEGDVISGGKVTIGPCSLVRGSVESVGEIELGVNAIVEGKFHSKSSEAACRVDRVRVVVNEETFTAVARKDE